MNKIIVLAISLTALFASAIVMDTVTCNVGDFTTTNVANQVETYSGKHTSVAIRPDGKGVTLNEVTFTNAASYALTGTAYKIESTIPIAGNTVIQFENIKNAYEPMSLYFLSTNGATVVDFIWYN